MERFPKYGKSPHAEGVASSVFQKTSPLDSFFVVMCDATSYEDADSNEQEEPDCKKCRGDKLVSTRRKTPSGQGRYMEKCPRCSGTGKEPKKK